MCTFDCVLAKIGKDYCCKMQITDFSSRECVDPYKGPSVRKCPSRIFPSSNCHHHNIAQYWNSIQNRGANHKFQRKYPFHQMSTPHIELWIYKKIPKSLKYERLKLQNKVNNKKWLSYYLKTIQKFHKSFTNFDPFFGLNHPLV